MSDGSSTAAGTRVGQRLLVKIHEAWLSCECVAEYEDAVVWETVDGRGGTMTRRLWDLNRERQRLESERGGAS